MKRRRFLQLSALTGLATAVPVPFPGPATPGRMPLSPQQLLGGLEREEGPTRLPQATWYRGKAVGDGLLYRFEPGALASFQILTADLLLDGKFMAAFLIRLQEGEEGPAFHLNFKLLNQCWARIRLFTSLVNQNRWRVEREGAWLKPIVGGSRVDLEKVDRMSLEIFRNGGLPVRWCMTDFLAAPEVPRLTRLILPRGPLLDELGQSTLHEWPGKSRSPEEVTGRLKQQLAEAPRQRWPESFSRWGGWKEVRFEGRGFFSRHHDGRRWWLVDPDGHPFWSAGLDSVRVDTQANFEGLEEALSWKPDPQGPYRAIYSSNGTHINYLAANFIRAFGPEQWYPRWAEISLSLLKRFGFNTVANWSDWQMASRSAIPYVRPLSFRPRNTSTIYRDFPDVFHPAYEEDARAYARELEDTVNDPALIGYFLMNEPTWGFSTELPAAGMLFNTPECATRKELARFLKEKYPDESSLSRAWGRSTSFQEISRGEWRAPLNETARRDLEEFSERMVDRFFRVLTEACRRVDPHHMNLGIRFHTVPPRWALTGMKYFDIFSMNCYREKIPADDLKEIESLLNLPTLIGEFHFGALDVGLPASGIGHVENQQARGQAYRVYVEDAAAHPSCVGTHWFIQYDQSALGRFDGENYNIGFQDVCNRVYEPLAQAARLTHERLYAVAPGKEPPFSDAPRYLPKLY